MDDSTNNTNAIAPKDESNVTLTIRLIMQGKVRFSFGLHINSMDRLKFFESLVKKFEFCLHAKIQRSKFTSIKFLNNGKTCRSLHKLLCYIQFISQ
uniref:Uncharacterized protein n=1 Tax=Megaselia scalaris TaxID=36166 RepID=T1GVW2_MEGSC